MNFDDIKSAWGKDAGSSITVPKKIEELKQAELPLDKIKRNMRYEGIIQVLAIIFIAFVPQIYKLKPALILPFNAIYILFVITCIYFLARFYTFYNRVGSAPLTAKDALYEVNYDIRLHMELYKMFTYMLFPFLLMILGLVVINKRYDQVVKLLQTGAIQTSFYLYFVPSILAIYALLHFGAVYWLKAYYLKYAQEIERILKELKEE